MENLDNKPIDEKQDKRDFSTINMILCGIVIGVIIFDSFFLIKNFNLLKNDPLTYLEQRMGKECQVICTDPNGLINTIYTSNVSRFKPFSQYNLNLTAVSPP